MEIGAVMGAAPRRARPERGGELHPHGPVLPGRGPAVLWREAGANAPGGLPPPVGHPVAGGGRPGAGQRAAHGREHAGARLPGRLPDRGRGPGGGAGTIRRAQGHGPAAAHLSLRAAG